MEKQLRPYQQEAIDAILLAMNQGCDKQMLVLATGLGKTLCATFLADRDEFSKTLWLTHTEELIDQSAGVLATTGKSVGIIKQKRMEIDNPIVVASVQTIHRRLDQLDPYMFDLIIIDECDLSMAVSWVKILDHFKPKLRLGMTATPFRADGSDLYYLFDKITYEKDILSGINDGFLCDIRAKRIRTDLGLDKVRTMAGDFNKKELGEIVDCSARNNLIVDSYFQYAMGRQAIAFCVDVKHAMNLCTVMQRRGIRAEFVVGDKELCPDRSERIARFKSGETKILTNVMVLTTGFDHPDVGCIDEDSEILTPDGWKGIDDNINKVISYNVKSSQLEVKKVLARTEKYSSKCIIAKSGKYNLDVTEDHRMLIETGRIGSGFKFKEAINLFDHGRFRMPISGMSMNHKDIPLSDLEIRFIAWFITDGGWARERTVAISQSKEDTIIVIRNLLNDLGYTYGEYIRKNNGYPTLKLLHSFRVAKGTRSKGWEEIRKYLDKKLHPLLMKMSKRQFDIFWKELLLGDGSNIKRKNCLQHLYSCEEKFIKNIQALAIRCGYSTNSRKTKLKSGKYFYSVMVSNKRHIEIKLIEKKTKTPFVYRKTLVKQKRYWCIQNKNETIVVRKDGKVSIVGNCIIMGSPTKSKRKFIQSAGRGTRLKTDKVEYDDCIILDIVDVTRRHRLINTLTLDETLPQKERLFIGKEKRDKAEADGERAKAKVMALQNKDEDVDLFKIPRIEVPVEEMRGKHWNEPASDAQIARLAQNGFPVNEGIMYTKRHAFVLAGKAPASQKQLAFLARRGYDVSEPVSFYQASFMLTKISEEEGWGDKKKEDKPKAETKRKLTPIDRNNIGDSAIIGQTKIDF